MSTADDRKKRIMEHLSRSQSTFSKQASSGSVQRKQQILDHIRRTRG